ncbi:MAG: isoprenylcysteine carboxylmethyltransferase family protein [Candidatus Thermoplasmatota archaeon]|nr:isoprenylcysteine carboxylmethyltransferase family protein [Candidatus Thermoplasmatota archaeon]
MTQKKGYELLKEKIPEFRSPWKSTAIFAVGFLLFLVCTVFFIWFDGLVWYEALLSQLIIALVCSAFAYGRMKNAKRYREKYGELAYRYYFFHFFMPMSATFLACMFHPLLVGGLALLPLWLAIMIGAFLVSIRLLVGLHMRLSGFDVGGCNLEIYTVFPEEGTLVSSEIYSYIRHPGCLGFLCVVLGFAFFRNNLSALLTALIFLIPVLITTRLEDNELTERFGEEHKKYIKNTGALFPHRNIGKFLKLLFFLERGML